MENNFSDEMDSCGVPQPEKDRVEVQFRHQDRDGVAVFSFEDDGENGDCKLENMFFKDDQSPIYPKDVLELDEIENEAIEKFLDTCMEHDEEWAAY